MLLLLRGRSLGGRLVGSSSSSFYSSFGTMALRGPASLTRDHSYSPTPPSLHLRLCYLHHQRLFSVSSRNPFSIRSIMTQRQDNSNGAPYGLDMDAAIRDTLRALNIQLVSYKRGKQHRAICPQCEGGSSVEKSLTLNISEDGGLIKWNCFRATCGFKGSTEVTRGMVPAIYQRTVESKSLIKDLFEERARLVELSAPQLGYLELQGITKQTLDRNGVKQLRKGSNSLLAFPYKEGGEIVSCKYYNHNFEFEEEKCTRKIFYGLDDIKNASQVIIVGQELDKFALEEAGFFNCVSVPDVPLNSQSKFSARERKSEDDKYEYLLNCESYLTKVGTFVLALGSDDDHNNLAEELARRLGREKCLRVNWPIDEDSGALCKDSIEVLRSKGPQALVDMITSAELYPIRGLLLFHEFDKEIDDYYHERTGNELGVSTGWRSLDLLYRVVPGELTLITGVPGSGKSEWVDALMCNLNRQKQWTFGLCSMENQVKEHGRKLLEKFLRKPFFNAPYSSGVQRMSDKEYEIGKLWLSRSFYLIRCENDELPSTEWVLGVARSAVMRYGIRGLVIDPYNELDHQRPPNMTETEYVSQMLSKIKHFAQHHECHVWFVAHPKQLQGWKGDPPSLYDISGSAHFINKCDAGIVVHRNRDPSKGPVDQVQIIVKKVRNKAAGMIGEAILDYDRATGEYRDFLA